MTRVILLVALVAASLGCRPGPPPARADDTPPVAPTDRLAIPATVRQALGITFAPVEVSVVERTLRIPGALEPAPGARREYRLPASGYVELLVEPFATVAEGDPLFRLRSPEWTARVAAIGAAERRIGVARAALGVRQAEARAMDARRAAARARIDALESANVRRADLVADAGELEADAATAAAALELARAEVAAAEGDFEAALAHAAALAGVAPETLRASAGDPPRPAYATIDAIVVHAAAPGVVDTIALAEGALAEPFAPALATIDPSAVVFRGAALQSDITRLQRAGAARLVPLARDPRAAVSASWSIGIEADARERTIAVRATPVDAADWIRPGIAAFLNVVVETTDVPVLVVPRDAVVESGLERWIFRRDPKDPDHAIRVVADLGARSGDFVELRSGVMAGDEVVLAGAYELAIASASAGSVPRGGHMHADGTFHADH